MRSAWIAILGLGACGKQAETASTAGAPPTWASRPTKPVSDQIKDVAFTLAVPDGLQPGGDDAASVERNWYGQNSGGKDHDAPSVMVMYEAVPTVDLDAAVISAGHAATDQVITKQAVDHGFKVVVRTLHGWRVSLYRGTKQVDLHCLAEQVKQDGEPGDDTRVMLERICDSLTVR